VINIINNFIKIDIQKDIGMRYANDLSREFNKLNSIMHIGKLNSRIVNGKSFVGLLSLGIVKGDNIKITLFNDNEYELQKELDIVNSYFTKIFKIGK